MALDSNSIKSQDGVGPYMNPPNSQRPVDAGEKCFAPVVLEPHDEFHRWLCDEILNSEVVRSVENVTDVGKQFIHPRINRASRLGCGFDPTL